METELDFRVAPVVSHRTIEQALAHAAQVREHGNDHCRMCDFPQDEGERNHAARYRAQLDADAFCVLLADEVLRLRAAVSRAK